MKTIGMMIIKMKIIMDTAVRDAEEVLIRVIYSVCVAFNDSKPSLRFWLASTSLTW